AQYVAPIWMRKKRGCDIGEEGDREPFEHVGDQAIGAGEHETEDYQGNRGDEPGAREGRDQEGDGGGDTSESGANIYGIGNEQRYHGRVQDGPWVVFAKHASQPPAADHA